MSTYERSYKPKPGELGEGYARRPNMGNIYVGFVKDNRDVQNMGRIRVWIPELGGDPNDENNWVTCSYVSPFAGATPVTSTVRDGTQFAQSQQSYGMFMQPPHLENEVIVGFINGSPNRGIYFGFLFQQFMNHSVPGMANSAIPNSTETAPTVEYNKFRSSPNLNPNDTSRPLFTPLAEGIANQGLFDDFLRGPTDASSRRESPSNVFGLISPRGHQLYIDDGRLRDVVNEETVLNQAANNDIARRQDPFAPEFIRLRTRSGTQIVINDTSGFIYLNSRNGNTWMQLSDTSFDVYSKFSINLRSERNINMHADGNINMFGSNGIFLSSDGPLRLGSTASVDIKGDTGFRLQSGTDMSIKSANLIAVDGNVIKIKENLAQDAIVARIIELGDRDSNNPSYPIKRTRTSVSQLPSHEPYAHGFRDLGTNNAAPADSPEATGTTAPSDLDPGLGSCAIREESGGDPARINPNDVGAPAYGIPQMNAGTGAIAQYLGRIQGDYPVIYQRLEAAGGDRAAREGTPEFFAAWRGLAADPNTRQDFINSQKIIAKEKWYDPTVSRIKNQVGTDLSQRGPGLKDMIYSLGVQHGPGGGATVAANALRGKDVNSMTDEEIIKAVYAERGRVGPDGVPIYFPKFAQQVGAARATSILQTRYARESQCNINKDRQAVAARRASASEGGTG